MTYYVGYVYGWYLQKLGKLESSSSELFCELYHERGIGKGFRLKRRPREEVEPMMGNSTLVTWFHMGMFVQGCPFMAF